MNSVLESNKLIAKFMNYVYRKSIFSNEQVFIIDQYANCSLQPDGSDEFKLVDLRFNTSWEWLMPVVEKIEDLDDSDEHYKWPNYEDNTKLESNFICYEVDISHKSCYIGIQLELDPYFCISSQKGATKLEATYNAVVEFIKWYNKKYE